MRITTFIHLSDAALLRTLTTKLTCEREITAAILALMAEVDVRRAYAAEGYSSMFAYCLECLHLSEDSASKRIHAARAARRVPTLLDALAEGRLHLSAVWLLAPHITTENADELIAAATHRRKSDIEAFLACRYPLARPTLTASIKPVSTETPPSDWTMGLFAEHAPGHVGVGGPDVEHAPGQVGAGGPNVEHPPRHVGANGQDAAQVPGHVGANGQDNEHAPEHAGVQRYLVRFTIERTTHDKLRHAQALLSHAVPSGDIAQVLDRALDALIDRLEKRKFGGAQVSLHPGERVSPSVRRTRSRRAGTRYIPSPVRRAVWERDEGRCTFVSAQGHRCESRRFLEFDHVEAFARGGVSTVDGLRLRCRAHNQFGADGTFGAGFMAGKRDQARLARLNAAMRRRAEQAEQAAERSAKAQALREAAEREAAAVKARREETNDLIAAMRGLGCRADDARRVAEHAMTLECASFEERLRAALAFRSRRTLARSSVTEAGVVRDRRARYGRLAGGPYMPDALLGVGALQARCPAREGTLHARYPARTGMLHAPGMPYVRPRWERSARRDHVTLDECMLSPTRYGT